MKVNGEMKFVCIFLMIVFAGTDLMASEKKYDEITNLELKNDDLDQLFYIRFLKESYTGRESWKQGQRVEGVSVVVSHSGSEDTGMSVWKLTTRVADVMVFTFLEAESYNTSDEIDSYVKFFASPDGVYNSELNIDCFHEGEQYDFIIEFIAHPKFGYTAKIVPDTGDGMEKKLDVIGKWEIDQK